MADMQHIVQRFCVLINVPIIFIDSNVINKTNISTSLPNLIV